MTIPFTDAPMGCVHGEHRWTTEWCDGPVAWCEACGAQPPARRALRRDP